MVKVQRFSDVRPCEVREMKFNMISEVKKNGKTVWIYIIPRKQATKRSDHPRLVFLDGICRKILKKYKKIRKPDEYVFRSQKEKDTCYTKDTYKQAIERACIAAGIEVWNPGQIRHRGTTEIAKKFGDKVAAACAGHTNTKTTNRYYIEQMEMAIDACFKMDRARVRRKKKKIQSVNQ